VAGGVDSGKPRPYNDHIKIFQDIDPYRAKDKNSLLESGSSKKIKFDMAV
jgi:hypothetical protein